GGLRIHVRGLAASAFVADGTLAIPPPPRGQFALVLDGVLPVDDDRDGVPDAIDDCPGVANPNQGGCPGTNDAGDGGGPAVAPGDGGGMDAINCEVSGACDRPNGTSCMDGAQCQSSFCVDGVCCANACIGPCRSCNQPNNDGTCLPYPQGTDPAS